MAPKTSVFGMFGQSPITALEEHMAKAHACVEALMPFFDAVMINDWARAEKLQIHIASLEHQADEIKKDLRLRLPRSLFSAVPRSDILDLVTIQDYVANIAKDISSLILLRKIQIPEALASELRIFLQSSIDASAYAEKAIKELDDLLETGFHGKTAQLLEDTIQQLDQIEHNTDEIQIKMQRKLFDIESELSPISAIFLYKIIDRIGELADRAQQVGEHMQQLLAH